ncbi:synaptogyrin [Brevipalpus obovatus]|uniref:synaptogyrin n=1 Tax=Brevipalpus obovatus TaxID=246614 RepID=UPI003D9E32D8
MDGGAAYGAAKAGIPFNVVEFVTRPQVILRFLCWLFSVVVYGSINNKGWYKQKCLYNGSGNVCRFGQTLGLFGLLGAVVLLVLEGLFQNISSIKVRRRIVAGDLGFSALWAVLYFFCFATLGISWSRSPYPEFGYGINNLRAAIAFSFFSIFSWAGCAYFIYLRWKAGFEMPQFSGGYEDESAPPAAEYYPYASGDANDAAYRDQGVYSQPSYDQYSGGNMPAGISQQQTSYPAPTY